MMITFANQMITFANQMITFAKVIKLSYVSCCFY